MTYKLVKKDLDGNDSMYVIRKADKAWIPKDTANTDYAKYLEWVAAGNTPEAAD